MNYIREINAFYDHMERHPLSASAVTLWHALMHINNKAMWSESFTVAGVVLRIKSGLTESSFKRARKELVDAGYIEYEPSKNRKAPTYKMVSLSKDTIEDPSPSYDEEIDLLVGLPECQNTDPVYDQDSSEMEPAALSTNLLLCTQLKQDNRTSSMDLTSNSHNREWYIEKGETNRTQLNTLSSPKDQTKSNKPNAIKDSQHVIPCSDHMMSFLANHRMNRYVDHNKVPLYKQNINQTRQNQTSSAASASPALTFYQENFGKLKPFVSNEIIDWSNQLGEELVVLAMARALERDVTTWAYVKSILRSWKEKGINSIEDAQLEDLEFKGRKKKIRRTDLDIMLEQKESKVPDWFEDQKKQNARKKEIQRQQREKELEQLNNPQYAKKVEEELERLLKQFMR